MFVHVILANLTYLTLLFDHFSCFVEVLPAPVEYISFCNRLKKSLSRILDRKEIETRVSGWGIEENEQKYLKVVVTMRL
jgi:hypothetical protein